MATVAALDAGLKGRIARLRLIRSELKRMIEACGGGPAADCRILDALSR